MNHHPFKLAMGQMLVEGGSVEANLSRAEHLIGKAARQGCSVIVLPECLDIGWTYPAARELAQPIPGPFSDRLCQAARESGLYVIAGLTERETERIYNSAILVAPQGNIMLKHRKINVLTIAQDLYATGGSLAVVETPLGTLGVNICADNFLDSLALGHSLARMGAQILLSPSAWAVNEDHDFSKDPYPGTWLQAYSTLAKLYDIAVIGVSCVGRIRDGVWKGRKCIGCSLAVGPGGQILAQGPYGETAESLLSVEIDLLPRKVTGTAIADMLKNKGYKGP